MSIFTSVFSMYISKYFNYRDIAWAIEFNRFCLEIIGLWPRIDEGLKNKLISDLHAAIILLIVITFCVIPLLCALVRVWGDMIIMIDNLQLTIPALIAASKIVIIRWKQATFSSILKMMTEDWMNLKLNSERNVMVKQAQIAQIIIICGYCSAGFAIILLFALPCFGFRYRYTSNITDRDRLLPLQTYYFYDTDKSPQYELTYVTQAVGVTLTSVIHISAYSFLGIAILHICGQLEIFRRQLVGTILHENFENAVRHIVRTHLRLIRFTRNIEDMFSLLLLGLVIYLSIIFCLYGFVLLNMFSGDDKSNASFSRKCFVIIGATALIGETSLYCGAGELLIERYERVYRAISNLEWYKLEPRNGRTFVLLMMQTNKSLYITAGKVIPLTMNTFCNLLKTSMGYISFLLAKQS